MSESIVKKKTSNNRCEDVKSKKAHVLLLQIFAKCKKRKLWQKFICNQVLLYRKVVFSGSTPCIVITSLIRLGFHTRIQLSSNASFLGLIIQRKSEENEEYFFYIKHGKTCHILSFKRW